MDVTVIRSNRKTISITINTDLTITVRAPKHMAKRDIEQFLNEKESWINKHLELMKQRNDYYTSEEINYLSNEEVRELAKKAAKYIPERADYYSAVLGVYYNRITIRCQKTRWGSCSSRGNLNFNCLLMLAPPQVIDYVVVHELCHLKEMNHSKAFWNEIAKIFPDYKESVKWLKNEGGSIMRRVR